MLAHHQSPANPASCTAGVGKFPQFKQRRIVAGDMRDSRAGIELYMPSIERISRRETALSGANLIRGTGLKA